MLPARLRLDLNSLFNHLCMSLLIFLSVAAVAAAFLLDDFNKPKGRLQPVRVRAKNGR